MKYFVRTLIIISILIPSASFAEGKSLTEDRNIKTLSIDTKDVEGKLKAGVVIGYPVGGTAGYRFSNFFEINGVLGTDFDDLTFGLNGLFTVFNFKISNEVFPISIGPAIYSRFDHHDNNDHNGKDDKYTKIDLLGIARIEYSFRKIPLNLFAEAGCGLELVKFTDLAGSFAIGARYIF